MNINTDRFSSSLPLSEYEKTVEETNRFPSEDLTPLLLGLFGEVGSVISVTKKYRREQKAYVGYRNAVEEEFGDTLWYFTAICGRFSFKITDIFSAAITDEDSKTLSASDKLNAPISPAKIEGLDKILIELGKVAASLLTLEVKSEDSFQRLTNFASIYIGCVLSMNLSFTKVVRCNMKKAIGRFIKPQLDSLPDFDLDFPIEEQLPRQFEIEISERKSGQSYLRWNGVFLGSPLTDNILNPDGYRFHDVFHLAYVAILHWSPTFRALIKHKRKSNPIFDEAQDSGRAIVVEEGLTAWLYSYSKELDHFEGHDSVSFDALKTIEKFVSGYEVQQCPLKLWEDAILQGYAVFRQVQKNNGGIVVGDRASRKLTYKAVGD
jgi:NTP pyrophosphatase (non-canonical NTP hydrolase)